MTGPAPLVLTDAWIERMLVERAGSSTPIDLPLGIVARIEVTPQRRWGLWPGVARGMPSRTRIVLIAATIALVALGITGALIGGRLQQPAPTDLPLPTAIRERWLGDPFEMAALGASSQPILDLSDGSLVLRGSGLNKGVLQSSVAMATPGTLRVTAAADAQGCPFGATATYRYTLSPGGHILTLATLQEDCPNRGAALARTWYRESGRCESGTSMCLGELEAGTFKSVNVDLRLSHLEIQSYVPTFGVLTYTVPDGWAVTRDIRTQLALAPENEEWRRNPDDQPPYLQVYARPTAYSQAEGCPYEALDPPLEASPEAFARWIAEHPGVDAGPIHEITIDGHPGRWLDLRMAPTWTSACPWSDGMPYAPLLFFEDGEDGVMGVGPTHRDRYIILDLGDGALVAVILHTIAPVPFDDVVAEAMPIVESFKFR